jgi:hypothetical protein
MRPLGQLLKHKREASTIPTNLLAEDCFRFVSGAVSGTAFGTALLASLFCILRIVLFRVLRIGLRIGLRIAPARQGASIDVSEEQALQKARNLPCACFGGDRTQ